MMHSQVALLIPDESGAPTQLNAPKGLPQVLQGDMSVSEKPVMQLAINLLFWFVVIAAVLMIMYSGIRMITSGGDSQKLMSAKKVLLYSVIGLVVASGAYFIVNTVIFVLGGNSNFFFGR